MLDSTSGHTVGQPGPQPAAAQQARRARGGSQRQTRRLVLDAAAAALAHPGRRGMLEILASYGELSAGELAQFYQGVTRQAVSSQLQVLLRAGLVTARRQQRLVVRAGDSAERRVLAEMDALSVSGCRVLYRINPHPLALVGLWIQQTLAALEPKAASPSDSSTPAAR